MTTTTRLLARRRFLPLFVTQFLNAFNDNLYKTAMVLFVVYSVYNDEAAEAKFSAIASGVFIAPFFILSAIAGQLADMRDKARIVRIVKALEIAIMLVGAAGLLIAWQAGACAAGGAAAGPCVAGPPSPLVSDLAIPLMLAALLAMGVHSTFIGPIKYAILPQHLRREEVLSGTGLVEAGTYLAILFGTILAGWIPAEVAAVVLILTALVGYVTARQIPPAPPQGRIEPIDWNPLTSSIRLIRATMGNAQVYYAILAISFFWTIGAVLFIQFPPLAKNTLLASKEVASLFLVVFSIGVAIGSIAINRMLKGVVSARYAPMSVMAMGLFIAGFYAVAKTWDNSGDSGLLDPTAFLTHSGAPLLMIMLLGIAIAGGMFVVPLYAFLTTKVEANEAARTIAANNIVNSGAMVAGSLLAVGLTAIGLPITEQLLLGAAMCLISAWLAKRLHAVEDVGEPIDLLD